MKTPFNPSALISWRFALFTTFGLLSGALLPAADTPAAAPSAQRVVSLVLLLSEPRTLDAAAAAHAVSRAWGSEVPESAVSASPPSFVIKSAHGRFAINNVDQPYFADSAKLAAELKDPTLAEAIRHHHGWLSVDWLENDDKADLRVVYQQISQIIVQLVRKDTLAIYSPDTDQFHLNDATLIGHLKSPDPLQDLVPAGLVGAEPAGNTVTINDDDPQLLAAQAEARKNWPAFMQAFKARGKDQYFAVKGRIIEGEASEYVWLQITDIDDTQVHGKLDSDPESLTKAKRGADLHIAIADVDDWLYSTGAGKDTQGGYTLRLFDELAQAKQKN
ncbi:MAG: DUF2314 domain-containing protein [Prosthecobacter sp.]